MKLTLTTNDGEVLGEYPIVFTNIDDLEKDGAIIFYKVKNQDRYEADFSDIEQDCNVLYLHQGKT